MSSQDKIQTDSKGKGGEEIPKASGSGSSAQVHPDEQGPVKGGVSPRNLSTLSTPPPLHEANKNINKWLNNTQTPSGAGTPSIQNQENAQVSSDPSSRILEELSQELDALAERPFNTQGKPGTSAPANTPQSCNYNALRPRAQSAGDAIARRLRMGPQANTMDGSVVPPPLFSTSNSCTRAGTSTSTPQNHQTFTAADILEYNVPQLPNKSAKRTLTSHASAHAAGDTERGPSASPRTVVLLNREYATGKPALAGIADAVHGLAQNPANLNVDAQQPAPQLLAENIVGMPPTPTIRAQQTSHLPIIPPPTAPLVRVVTEPESFHDSSTAPFPSFHESSAAPFLNFSSIGRQHSLQASTGEAFSIDLTSSS